jgi:hypothetical protein
MYKSIQFLIVFSTFVLSSSFLTRYRINPNYSAVTGQTALAIGERKFQNTWHVKSFQTKNFVRNFNTEIKREKFYIAYNETPNSNSKIIANKVAEIQVNTSRKEKRKGLSPWQFQIQYKIPHKFLNISILAIPYVVLEEKNSPTNLYRLTDLEIANLVVEALSKENVNDYDWIVVHSVVLDHDNYGCQLIKRRENMECEPDLKTIVKLILKSEFGKIFLQHPETVDDLD